jgi:hypothetical protein
MKLKTPNFFRFKSQRERCIFLVIAGFYLIFLLARVSSENFYLFDSYEYLDVANNVQQLLFLEQGENFSSFAKRPPVYPIFLSLFLSFHPVIIMAVQSVIGCFSVLILFRILNDFGIKLDNWFLGFLLLTPSVFIYTQLFMSEWLIFFLLSQLFFLLTRKQFSAKNFALVQLITLALAFTKPVFYPLIYLNFLFFGIYFIKKRRFSLWLFIPILVLQSYLNLNEKISGYRYFSTIENINLISYNLYYFKSATQSPEVAEVWIDSIYTPQYAALSIKQQNDYLKNIAYAEIKNAPFSYGFYHIATAIRGIFDPGRFDLMTFFKKEDGKQGFLEIFNGMKSIDELFKDKLSYVYLLLIPIGVVNCVKLFYATSFVLTQKLDVRLYYLIVTLLAYILLTGPVNSSRYMMPLQGIIIVFALLGINKKTQKFS